MPLQQLPRRRPRGSGATGCSALPVRKWRHALRAVSQDRIRFVQGAELLRTVRLGEATQTRRVFAGCCNTPVFMEFENGHWLSLYGCLWAPDTLPPLQLRTMTADLADPSVLDDAVPNKARQSLRFYTQLLGAWIAMGFACPKIPA
jgi:hypothetical protein